MQHKLHINWYVMMVVIISGEFSIFCRGRMTRILAYRLRYNNYNACILHMYLKSHGDEFDMKTNTPLVITIFLF